MNEMIMPMKVPTYGESLFIEGSGILKQFLLAMYGLGNQSAQFQRAVKLCLQRQELELFFLYIFLGHMIFLYDDLVRLCYCMYCCSI